MRALDIAGGFTIGVVLVLGGIAATEWTHSQPPPLPGKYRLSTGDRVTTEVIDGCEYLLLRGALTHKGNCSAPIHLRGGALLEDWNNR